MIGLFSLMYDSDLILACEWHGDLKTSSRVINPLGFEGKVRKTGDLHICVT